VLAREDEKTGGMHYAVKVITQRVLHTGEYYEETPKTRASRREVPITKKHYYLLREHHQLIEQLKSKGKWFDDDLVFPSFTGHAIDPHNLKRSFKAITKYVGLRPIKFHTMRKTYATYVTKSLIDQNKFPPKVLQQLLGHARADVAMNVYAKVIEKDYLSATFTPVIEPSLPEPEAHHSSKENIESC